MPFANKLMRVRRKILIQRNLENKAVSSEEFVDALRDTYVAEYKFLSVGKR